MSKQGVLFLTPSDPVIGMGNAELLTILPHT